MAASVIADAKQAGAPTNALPWIDDDEETRLFTEYWFAEPQRSDLRGLALALSVHARIRRSAKNSAAADVLRIALSRIIITKDQGASLARDVSHSRPHKVADSSGFDVPAAFERSVRHVRKLLANTPPRPGTSVSLGDARAMRALSNRSIDAVLTSPPYLNAIDYMRGHRLSLVWLGHRLSDLRNIRSNSIGSERGPDGGGSESLFADIQQSMGVISDLPRRHASMVARYAEDVYRLMSEISRVMAPSGRAILVVGNSCLKGTFVKNSAGVARAGAMVGLRVTKTIERELPDRHRYLPMPAGDAHALGKRMRTETILSFAAA